jgi:hypothetical protein
MYYIFVYMGVISIRIPLSLKRSMKETDINWPEEIRAFIEKTVRRAQKKRTLAHIETLLEGIPEPEKGTARTYVRKDRGRD